VERDGIPRKTAQFEAAWRERRCKWLDSVQNGTSTGVIELNTSPSADIWSGAGTKRVCFSSQYPSCFQCQVIFTYGVTSRATPTQISLPISRPLMHPLPLLSNDQSSPAWKRHPTSPELPVKRCLITVQDAAALRPDQ